MNATRTFVWSELVSKQVISDFVLVEQEILFSPKSGTHRASYSERAGFIPPGVKRLGREVYQSPAANAEVKNVWRCTSAPLIRLHGLNRDNFTLLHPDLSVYFLQAGI